jgi:hypothetical protein
MFIMGASKDSGVGDSRAVYSPPCVVKINEPIQGAGFCNPVGSGDSGYCSTTGNSAAGGGCCTGNNTSSSCYESGNSATGVCYSHGNSGGAPFPP